MRPDYTRDELRALTALLLLAVPILLALTMRKSWSDPSPPSIKPLRLDVNRASRDALQALPGVGPKTANRIARGRPYRSLADVRALLGARRFARIAPYVVCRPRKPG